MKKANFSKQIIFHCQEHELTHTVFDDKIIVDTPGTHASHLATLCESCYNDTGKLILVINTGKMHTVSIDEHRTITKIIQDLPTPIIMATYGIVKMWRVFDNIAPTRRVAARYCIQFLTEEDAFNMSFLIIDNELEYNEGG